MGILIIDRQHGEKSPGNIDPGAQVRIGDRRITELELTSAYAEVLAAAVSGAGHQVIRIDSGGYGARNAHGNQIARDSPGERVLYLALHVNAGRGTYALAMHDHKSRGGAAAAEHLAPAMGALEGISRAKVVPCESIGWTSRAHRCIRGIWRGPANISGVLLEPFFIDSAGGAHDQYREPAGLELVGQAIAAGALAYLGPAKKPKAKKAKAKKAEAE